MNEEITIKLRLDHGQMAKLSGIIPSIFASVKEISIKESTNKLLKVGSSATYLDTYDVVIVIGYLLVVDYVIDVLKGIINVDTITRD